MTYSVEIEGCTKKNKMFVCMLLSLYIYRKTTPSCNFKLQAKSQIIKYWCTLLYPPPLSSAPHSQFCKNNLCNRLKARLVFALKGSVSYKMPSEESILENIDNKFITVKEELEELIDDVKNDVDDKAIQIVNNRRYQDQSFEQLHTAMDRLRKELKQMSELIFQT